MKNNQNAMLAMGGNSEILLPEQFRSINSTSNIIYTCVFYDYHIVSCNPSFLEMFSIIPGKETSFDLRKLFTGNELAEFINNCRKGIENYNGFLHYHKPKHNGIVQLFTYLFHFPLAKKTFHGLIAYEPVNKAVPEGIPRLNTTGISPMFADNITELVEVVSADYSYTYVNDRACEYFGRSREELLTMSSLDTIYPEDLPYSLEYLRDVMSGEKSTFEIEVRSMHSSGRSMWTHFSGRAIVDDTNGVIGYLTVGWDVTERKESEENMKRIKSQLEQMVTVRTQELEVANQQLAALNDDMNTLITNIPMGILMADETGKITVGNNYLEETIGEDLQHIIRQLGQEIQKQKNPYLQKLFRDGGSFRNVEIVLPLSGKKDAGFYITGVMPRQDNAEKKSAILLLTPAREVLGLANRISNTDTKFQFSNIITLNTEMQRTIQKAKAAAGFLGNVLITGESGTGKEMFAQAIHNYSGRKGPFISINCGAIPRELVASELFGYTDGAFTGASKGGKPGKFELANKGTLFLDEIGDMPLEQQVSLLRVLQERCITKIGGVKTIPIDCRIICATNIDLADEVRRNNFRKDLYFRLNVIDLHITPLRHRHEDIPVLLDHFCSSLSNSHGGQPFHLPDEFLPYLIAYQWPGNVRELQNVIERLYYLSVDAPLTLDDLPAEIRQTKQIPAGSSSFAKQDMFNHPATIQTNQSIHAMLTQEKEQAEYAEAQRIMSLLRQYDGNITRVAQEMGIARSTLYRKIKKYGTE